jgi:hypothetical protein
MITRDVVRNKQMPEIASVNAEGRPGHSETSVIKNKTENAETIYKREHVSSYKIIAL